ncbi:hypothetical protein PoB_000202000 [Plakobranchus ocellatus]|uniref:Uncharacterized protein n=1 Tax=Plakobranchus ocellatus TaxID=259542 RepID=A0AAV3XXJ3_9GAST|nr:hypothetical protein PoB_000202000 [Plakobranchus ocellatus]
MGSRRNQSEELTQPADDRQTTDSGPLLINIVHLVPVGRTPQATKATELSANGQRTRSRPATGLHTTVWTKAQDHNVAKNICTKSIFVFPCVLDFALNQLVYPSGTVALTLSELAI